MKKVSNKVMIMVIMIIIIIIVISINFYKQHLFRLSYEKALEQKECEYINSFYKSSFSGIITYIKLYEKSPNKYVLGIKDSSKVEKTIGKVEIINFVDAKIGDTVRKKNNSFELEISGQNGKFLSQVKYQ